MGESVNRGADMLVHYVTRCVRCSFIVCVGSGFAREEATEGSVSSAVQQMDGLKISNEQQ